MRTTRLSILLPLGVLAAVLAGCSQTVTLPGLHGKGTDAAYAEAEHTCRAAPYADGRSVGEALDQQTPTPKRDPGDVKWWEWTAFAVLPGAPLDLGNQPDPRALKARQDFLVCMAGKGWTQ